jgi:hypothetical protein
MARQVTKSNHENTKIHEEHEEDLAIFFVTFEIFVSSWSRCGR